MPIEGAGSISVEVSASAFARYLCLMTHPIALGLGTIKDTEPCCSHCALATEEWKPCSEGCRDGLSECGPNRCVDAQ